MPDEISFLPHKPWLAPLAGWSNLAFRLICREQGASVACTEMISAKGLVYGGRNTYDLLISSESDNPLVAQIFGAEHDFMQQGIAILQKQGFKYFDVNVGCSVHKVLKTGAGAAMFRDIPNFLKVAESVIKQVHFPSKEQFSKQAGKIGFKIRLGYEMGNDVYLDVAKELEKLGADWITLHPRYAKQAFGGKPNYQALAKLKQAVKIPIIASGDLFEAKDGVNVILETAVDTVMYARGAMANPFIFQEHKKLWQYCLENNLTAESVSNLQDVFFKNPSEHIKNLKELILHHLDYAMQYHSHTALLQMRTIVPRYVKNMENAKQLRLALIGSKSYEEVLKAIDDFF